MKTDESGVPDQALGGDLEFEMFGNAFFARVLAKGSVTYIGVSWAAYRSQPEREFFLQWGRLSADMKEPD